jgi:hypothetical protein
LGASDRPGALSSGTAAGTIAATDRACQIDNQQQDRSPVSNDSDGTNATMTGQGSHQARLRVAARILIQGALRAAAATTATATATANRADTEAAS